MNFKKKKIRKFDSRLNLPKKPTFFSLKKLTISVPVMLSLFIIFSLIFGTVYALKQVNLSVILSIAGDDLEKDSYGHTNILIMGSGGEGHDGGDLMDTIMVASIDNENKFVSMLSIPRDFYIKDPQIGSSRINEVFFNARKKFDDSEKEGFNYMKRKVEDLLGTPIHYWVQIDFKGFTELVDAIGGIDVDVKEPIYDPFYPKDGTYGYEPFKITAGPQHLDGATALKYARSRKTTSDFDRAERQQQIIYAIKEQALKMNTLLSPEKIDNILSALKNNIATNLTTKEILTFGSYAAEYKENKIIHRLIHDDPSRCGGFLYTPERQYYGGMFVLLPAGGFDHLQMYSDLTFNFPFVAHEGTRIQVLNGTKSNGAAGETKQILQRLCFDITRYGNAMTKDITETTYYYPQKYNEKGKQIDSRPKILDYLQKIIPGKESTTIPQDYIELGYDQSADLIIELGADYTNSEKYLSDPFYSVYTLTPSQISAPPLNPEKTDSTLETEAEPDTQAETNQTTDTPNNNGENQ